MRELGDLNPTALCFPKFFRMRFWSETNRALGSSNLTSTGYGERAHADVKAFKNQTYRHASAKDQAGPPHPRSCLCCRHGLS